MVKGSALKYLKCPICDGDFLESGNSILCKKGHCYDISKGDISIFRRIEKKRSMARIYLKIDLMFLKWESSSQLYVK